MRDPYDILGIPNGADDNALREAYRRLARQYEGNPRKLDEINNAYDSVILARGSGGYSTWQKPEPTASAWAGQRNTQPDLGDARKRIQDGRFDDALTLLDGTPVQRRGADWHYLKGCAQRGRGWLEEAEKLFLAAAEMDPGRREYRSAYEEMHSRRSGEQRNNRAEGEKDDDDKCCGICGSLLCADCCCECFGYSPCC
ncbi:MAG: hypothetical protein LBS96_01860 [Oscillospiraceae bacterium]|jgi:curved DNA-binding protein CbpA|nr:hypothetical protein [Oscillospiraceae bacterium]